MPETEYWPAGWVPNAQTWLPAKPPSSQPQFVHVLNKEIQSRNDGDTINQSKPYSGGIGGPCEVFDPPCAALPLLCSYSSTVPSFPADDPLLCAQLLLLVLRPPGGRLSLIHI